MGTIRDMYNKTEFYEGTRRIPLGTKHPLFVYRNRATGKYEIPSSEIVWLTFTTQDQFSMMIILAAGAGKCAYSEVMTITDKGPVKIKDLKIGNKVLSYNPSTNTNEFKKVIAKELNGTKPVYEIITRSGQKITLTENHPVLTEYGFVQVRDLIPGWSIFSPRHPFDFKEKQISREDELFLYLSSYLVADGYLMSNNFVFTKKESSECSLFKQYLSELKFPVWSHEGKKGKCSWHSISVKASSWLKEKGLHIAKSADKRLPELIFQAPKNVKCHALRLLFDCDGTVGVYKNKKTPNKQKCTFEYCSKSKYLVQQVGLLLNSLGIQVRYLTKKVTQFNKEGVDYYRLFITDYNNLKRFADLIGFTLQRKMKLLQDYLNSVDALQSNSFTNNIPYNFLDTKIKSKLNAITWTNKSDYKTINTWKSNERYRLKGLVPPKYSRVPSQRKLKELAYDLDPCVWFDEIKEIKCIGPKETWDIEVKDNANFFAGDLGLICVHNTRFLKRIIPYFINKFKYKGLIMDCKGFDAYFLKYPTKDYNTLLKWESPSPMDTKSYFPCFARKKAEEYHILSSPNNYFARDFDVFSYRFEDISDVLEAATLGFPDKARIYLCGIIRDEIIRRKITETKEVIKLVKCMKMNTKSQDSILDLLSFFDKEMFFDYRYPKINIARDWNQGITPTIHFLEPQEGYASFYGGKIMSDIYTGNFAEGKNKIFIIDDASKLVGSQMGIDKYLSVQKVIETMTLGRFKKFNLIVSSQSFSILNSDIFPHFKYKIVGKLGAADLNLISKFCSPDITWAIKTLQYDPPKQIKEMLLIYPDNIKCEKFFPLGPLTYHV